MISGFEFEQVWWAQSHMAAEISVSLRRDNAASQDRAVDRTVVRTVTVQNADRRMCSYAYT